MAWTNKRKISETKRAAAVAMLELGSSTRQVGKELGISKSTAAMCVHDPLVNRDNVEMVKARMTDRMIVSADRFLSHGLDGIKDLHPYQAVLCAGIMHDHYLRAQSAGRSTGASSITNILIQIDQSLRSTTISSIPASDPNAT